MDNDSVLSCFGNKLLEILVEMFDDLGADGVRLLSTFLPIGQGFERVDTLGNSAFGVYIERALKGLVSQRFANSLMKCVHEESCDLAGWAFSSPQRMRFSSMPSAVS